ncbi:guanylate kinase-like isoform X2 [Anoplophora glabripennis]|uniref:guanylate kinase-like isoform X2 n=1 Tax=Anoplophora glabripennis TaxID=217634 RepID=UPI000874DD13|nr:guanylate kinase-like isoform X2 [Anoplophora glabripennis]
MNLTKTLYSYQIRASKCLRFARSSYVKGLSNMSDPKRVRPLLIFGPSGSGKSTLVKKMLEEFPDKFGFSVSHTTRKPRPGEEHGKHYHFIDVESMKRAIEERKFLEHAVFSGNYYGTSKAAVEEIAKQDKVCVLDIDVQGVRQVKKTDLNPWSVFVKPPSMESLKQRLVDRKTETEESLDKRLSRAQEEIEYGTTPGNFDLVIVNDDLDRAYSQLREFVVDKVLKNKVT